MTGVELSVIFLLGLVSSLHCVQMCGPIVLAYSLSSGPGTLRSRAALLGHLAYNSGRIITYALLGALAGLAGHAIGYLGTLTGLSSAVTLAGGGMMLLAGIGMTGVLPGPKALRASLLKVSLRFIRPLSKLIGSPRVVHRLLLGLSLGLLPCGLVYAALLRAVASGSPFWGACTMLAFGAGTAGALLAVGMFSSALRTRFQRMGTQLAAVGVMAMGVALILRGAMPQFLQGAHGPHVCH